ncbi:hypothetical protein [Leptospira terpstrae]|uniref:Uncharacterized protein n=1 Tax=Leptospira terpstrae serovar Hualin str. LT 11-33 = ATCC 700639 TaxID=1257025 RepID=N1VKE0_9LEPT|nr:hypothetical protein [Leptospira terpstrae]EMY60199.1 hypothetical protein LEP1GSC203_0803 [Leptospira terpstrae serovar Hualin str. LT 11-33 = ATCC 700639]
MKTPNLFLRFLKRLRNRTIQFVRWNFLVLLTTGLSIFLIQCESKNPEAETHLVPILLATDANTASQQGNGQGGSLGTDAPIAIEDQTNGIPILNEITYFTNHANPADDPYATKGLLQFQKTSVSFQKPVPENTEVSLYFGKKNMELQADGTVINSLTSIKRTAANFSGYSYLADADKKYKVFVVAKNQFGLSTKQLTIGHPRNCADAMKIPATWGNCDDHCITATKVGETVELTANYNLPSQGTSLHLDLVGVSPRSFPETIAPAVDLDIPIPNAGLHSTKTSFNIHDKEFLCTKVVSFLIIDQPLRSAILQGYLNIPND